jgi:hypothetical protein
MVATDGFYIVVADYPTFPNPFKTLQPNQTFVLSMTTVQMAVLHFLCLVYRGSWYNSS